MNGTEEGTGLGGASDHRNGIHSGGGVEPPGGVRMKPIDVVLLTPPLVGTMERSEVEAAAALMVRTLQATGNIWRPLRPKEIGELIHADLEAGVRPVCIWDRNPFFRPDFQELVELGFAEYSEDNAMGFTEKGLQALERWARGGNDGTV